MTELFPITQKLPDGFSYHSDFITLEEEQHLYDTIKDVQLHTFIFQGYEAKRKVASFGYDYSFDKKVLTKGAEIPASFYWLISRVAQKFGLQEDAFAELLVTKYPVGSVINWHRDAPPFDVVAGISLCSDCTFKLRPHEQMKRSRKSTVSLRIARRSLYIMSGVSRQEWQHCTAPVDDVRYSVTLRTLKPT